MLCLPLIERELRVALRKQRPARTRLKVAALAVGGTAFFLLMGVLTGSRRLGQTLEQGLCLAGLYFVIRAPLLTAGVLAEERRNQTLGLLFLSGLSAGEVFAGKLLSSALVAFTNLLVIFPMLALPFLVGGVSFDLFLAIIFALPVLMVFALAVSLLASALTRDDGAAVVLAGAIGTVLCVAAPAIYVAQAHYSAGALPSLWWLRLSPGYGPYLVWRAFGAGFRAGQMAEFWGNVGMTLTWSALALGAAAFALKRLWREREVEEASSGWGGRWRSLVHGDRKSRQRLARAWLEVNPFVWLAGRDRQPAALGWMAVGGIALVWLLCWAAWPARWPSVQNFFITATVLNSVVIWFTRLTAAQVVGQPRRDGAYELLLTTPLNPSDVVWGTFEALRWQFRALADCVFAFNALMLVSGLGIRKWTPVTLAEYVSICLFLLVWTWRVRRRTTQAVPVMWASLNSGRPALAAWRTSGINAGSWIWIVFNLQTVGRGFQRFPTGAPFELFLVALFLFIGLMLWIGSRFSVGREPVREMKWDPVKQVWMSKRATVGGPARNLETRLINEFREIVREPLPDPADPRFKKWNIQERFPWSQPDALQQHLVERTAMRTGHS